jgi:hypothetical protein
MDRGKAALQEAVAEPVEAQADIPAQALVAEAAVVVGPVGAQVDTPEGAEAAEGQVGRPAPVLPAQAQAQDRADARRRLPGEV